MALESISKWSLVLELNITMLMGSGNETNQRLSMARKAAREAATMCGQTEFPLTEEFDQLPVAPWFDLHGRVIPNHPQLPTHWRNTKPDLKNAVCRVARRFERRPAAEKRDRALLATLPEAPMTTLKTHEDFYPDFAEDWIDVTEEARQDYLLPTHVANVPSRVT